MDTIFAECEIKSLLVRERHYRDTYQWDKLRALYHPDPSNTSIRVSWFTGDINGFISGSRTMSNTRLSAIHMINPVDITIVGSKAFAVSVGNITGRFDRHGDAYDLTSCCRFLSRLQRIDDSGRGAVWKMLTMDVIGINDSVVAAVPTTNTFYLEGCMKGKAGSYVCLSRLLAKQGYEFSADFSGADGEQSLKDVMNWGRKWLDY